MKKLEPILLGVFWTTIIYQIITGIGKTITTEEITLRPADAIFILTALTILSLMSIITYKYFKE